MKVVIVAPYFYPRVGGAEVYTINIARQLKASGWDVVVVTTGDRTGRSVETVEGMTVYRLCPTLTISNTPVGLGWRRELRRIFVTERPDVINAHTPVPFLADMAQRSCGSIPFVLTYHNDLVKDAALARSAVFLAYLMLINKTLKKSKKIIATSKYYVEQSNYLINHRDKTKIVSPGVDLGRFNPRVEVGAELAKRFSDSRVILFVGSLNKSHVHKGLDILIAAFRKVAEEYPDTCLVVVGAGNGMEIYRTMAEAAGLGGRVHFTGYVDEDVLAQYYRLSTVFAMPSTNRSEGFGMTYIEANAVGTPVVGCDVGGIPYSVKDNETGLLAQPNSAQSLYLMLRRLLDDESLAQRLGIAGAERAASEFSWEQLGRLTGRILSEAAAPAPCSRRS